MMRDIVLMQQRELAAKLAEPYVERDVAIPKGDDDLIRVVLGPRRAGKSFLAMRLVRDTGSYGYVNFDDERLARLQEYDSLISSVNSVYGNPRCLLLDEIQNVPSWELLVNRLQRQGFRLFLTGSNANLLSRELATHLTGRHLPIVVLPFSFRESLRLSGQPLTSAEKAEALRTYIETGGYPEPLIKGVSRRDYLITLFRSLLYKDIVVRHRIRSPLEIEDLARFLLANVSQRHSVTGLGAVMPGRSKHTVQNYLKYLAEAFIVFGVPRFSFKFREQIRSATKMYSVDTGMVSACAAQFSRNAGILLENAVAIELQRGVIEGAAELFFWQGDGQEEVDFVVRKDRTVVQLIQVCLDASAPKVWSRETRALVNASHQLGCPDLLLLTDNQDSEHEVSWFNKGGHVRVMPAWRWLLER